MQRLTGDEKLGAPRRCASMRFSVSGVAMGATEFGGRTATPHRVPQKLENRAAPRGPSPGG